MATIKDVAAVAGVSTATVSHVINGTRYVSEEVKGRVRAAMEELHYVPNLSAFSLRTQRTKTVSLLIPILLNEADCIYFSQVARGVESVLRTKGYFTILGNTNDDTAREIEEIQNGKNRMVDGMIIAPTADDQSFIRDFGLKCPCIFLDRPPPGLPDQTCILSDTYTGSKNALQQMICLGHRRIGMVILPMFDPDERLAAYRRALADSGIAYDPALVRTGANRFETGYRLTKDLLEECPDITALFCATNHMAIGAMQYLRDRHIRIPEQMSILVFDDYDWSRLYDPPLTVIRQDAVGLGKKAAEVLLQQIESQEELASPQEHRLPMELITRESWAPPCQS